MDALGTLLQLKLTLARNSFFSMRKRSRLEFFTFLLFFPAVIAGLFALFLYSFRFFHAQEPFGPILADEAFYLFTFALFIMLVISSAVSSYASVFRSPEIPFLAARPPSWSDIYFLKLTEALGYSSWALLLVAAPFMTAYGITKGASPLFLLYCLLYYIPFIILAGTLGILITTILVRAFPGKRSRQWLLLTAGAGILCYFFFEAQPGMIRDQGSVAGLLSGYLPHVSLAKSPLFPSTWLTRGIISLSPPSLGLTWENAFEGLFYFLLLLSNTFFLLIPAYSASRRLYPRSFLALQDHADARVPARARSSRLLEKITDRLPWPSKPMTAFLEKDVKTFFRDPSEWSQMIIFFGLLLLYFANLKSLEFHLLKTFWKNIVFVLNTVGTYIVLSSFSMRFIFPMISLEGTRFWIINLSPIRPAQILLEKFFLGTFLSAVFTAPLVFFSGWMLEIPAERVFFTTGLGFFVCVALTGLSVGFGAAFPNFRSTNPAEIISGFGGALLIAAHLTYLTLIGVFLALSKEGHALVFLTVAAISLLIGALPLKMGIRALQKREF